MKILASTKDREIFTPDGNLFPTGTKLVASAYFILPKKIRGETRRGKQFFECDVQYCESINPEIFLRSNSLTPIRFIAESELPLLLNSPDYQFRDQKACKKYVSKAA